MRVRHLVVILLYALLLNSCSSSSNKKTNGYVEGRYTYVTTNASGFLEKLHVRKGHIVKEGQLLFSLDVQSQANEVEIAEENLKQALATHAQVDIAAQTAALAETRWMQEQKLGTAPVNGLVFDIYYHKGDYTVAQKPIISLLAPENIKAIFYIPRSDLTRIHLKDKIMISCDGCRQVYPAHVSYIASGAESTPPVIDNAEINSQPVFKIEAQFSSRDAYRLHPGQPIHITYNLNERLDVHKLL